MTRHLSLKHFNESNKQLKVKTHFHDLKNEHQRPQFSDPTEFLVVCEADLEVLMLFVRSFVSSNVENDRMMG